MLSTISASCAFKCVFTLEFRTNGFLDNIELSFLGWLPSSQVISNSILSRKPFVLNSKVNKHLNAQLAEIVSNIHNAHPCKTNSIRFFDK